MINNILVEVCCGSVDDCIVATKCGADRIELNHALELGGLTPSLATLRKAKEVTKLPICTMVRPRGAGFNYSEKHYEVMLEEAKDLLEAGADGIVFGFLDANKNIDVLRTQAMVALIKKYQKEAIFHKAFDSSRNMEEACVTLIECGIDRILTSGGNNYPHIEEGFALLSKLIKNHGDKIQILPGGGVRPHNIANIVQSIGSSQIHLSAKCEILDEQNYVAVSADNLQASMKALKEQLK